jgi:hypothetical protein
MSQMQLDPDMLMKLLMGNSNQRFPEAMGNVQPTQAPPMQNFSREQLLGYENPISSMDPFFQDAASPAFMEDMEVNHYRQALHELMKKGYFQGGEPMLQDNNALLANRTLIDLAMQTQPLIEMNKYAGQFVQDRFPEEAFARQQQQALEKWKLQKYHDAKVKEMSGNKLIAGQ